MLFSSEQTTINAIRKYLTLHGFAQVNPTIQPITFNIQRAYGGAGYLVGGTIAAATTGYEYISNMQNWTGSLTSLTNPGRNNVQSVFFGQVNMGLINYSAEPATYSFEYGFWCVDPNNATTLMTIPIRSGTQALGAGAKLTQQVWNTMDENASMIPFSFPYYLVNNTGATGMNVTFNMHFEGYGVYGL